MGVPQIMGVKPMVAWGSPNFKKPPRQKIPSQLIQGLDLQTAKRSKPQDSCNP